MKPKYQIETGYKIGGRTWISDRWNAGELTRDEIHEAIADYLPDNHKTDDELRAELMQTEAEYARERFEEDNTMPYDELLNDCVERQLNCIQNEEAEKAEVAEALQDVFDNWTDDTDDEDHFDRVYLAHKAVDDYCR